MPTNQSQTVEDYLKTIYEFSSTDERASTNQIAKYLGISPASVTGMLRKLAEAEPPLVEYHKHHGVALTSDGEKIALEIVRHHRLLEMFLYQVLGYSWDEVHPEADRLEHVISEEFEERIAQALGDPALDPHGDPIPTRELKVPEQHYSLLADMRPGQQAMVQRVRDTSPEILRYLSDLGIKPGERVRIQDYSPLDENLTLKIVGRPGSFVLGERITRLVYVELQ